MKRYLIVLMFLLVCALSLCSPCLGQVPQSLDDPIAEQLFPPDLVMQYRQEIGLTADQAKAVKEEVQRAQARFLDMQWDMQSERDKLVQLLKARVVDEGAALAHVDKVLDREREIKKVQVSLLIRIKNQLTAAQQNKLTELRRKPS